MLRGCLSDEPGGRLVGRRAPIQASSSGVKDGMLSRPIVGSGTRCQRTVPDTSCCSGFTPCSASNAIVVGGACVMSFE